MALLVLLQELQRLHHWPLSIWHGDHGWHPGSAVIAAELQSWCQQRALPVQVDQAPQTNTTSEASARQWRYSQLQQRAEQLGADVFTGHTARAVGALPINTSGAGPAADNSCQARSIPAAVRVYPDGA